jgi:hypothetical protein
MVVTAGTVDVRGIVVLLLLTSPPRTLRAVGGGSAAGPSHSRRSLCGALNSGAIGSKRTSTEAQPAHRCPNTGMQVQGWFADNGSENGGETYEATECIACRRVHLVNPKTGKTLTPSDD